MQWGPRPLHNPYLGPNRLLYFRYLNFDFYMSNLLGFTYHSSDGFIMIHVETWFSTRSTRLYLQLLVLEYMFLKNVDVYVLMDSIWGLLYL